ncbi:MAG: SBBP repeat-containing protein, partial [Verrucomicrobiota bacterium]
NQAVKMALDGAGNIYVTGFSQNTNGNLDYATIKYAPNGSQVWVSRFDSTNAAKAKAACLVLDVQTNVIVTGTAGTLKYDNNGIQLWCAAGSGYSLALDSSNNVFVTTTFATNLGLLKLSPAGSNLWELSHSVAYIAANLGQSLSVGSSGNSYMASYISFYSAGYGPYYFGTVTKYDSNGTVIWSQEYEDGYYLDPVVQSTDLDKAGNFYVLVNSYGPGGSPYQTGEFSGSTGSVVWAAGNPTGGAAGVASALALDNVGNVLVTGANTHYYPNTQYGTYKIGTNGTYVWTNLYPNVPTATNVATSIACDQANSVYVTGYSPGTNSSNDIVTIKYDKNGNQIWLQRYNGPGNGDDEGNAIAVDANGNVYVTGYETTAAGGTEFVTIKYAPTASIQKQTNGGFLLQEQGEPGEAFDFQASTNLQTWLDLGATNADTNGCVQFLDTNAPLFDYRFYLTLPQ